jgi:hypothetical protein
MASEPLGSFIVSCPCARGERTGGGGRERAPQDWVFEGLGTTTEECAEDVVRTPGAPCASKRVVKAVAAYAKAAASEKAASEKAASEKAASEKAASEKAASALLPSAPTAEAAAIRAAALALHCNSESCVLAHPDLRRFVVEKRLLPEAALNQELETRFKASGPRGSTGLLSNFNLDETLQRWARVFDEFHPCPFAMMDFDRTREAFAAADLPAVLEGRAPLDLGPGFGTVRRPAACYACVVNTDHSTGPGKHWVAVFVDARPPPGAPWTVEYFNSAGHPPPKAMVGWMERNRARLAEYRAGLPSCRGRVCDVISVPVTDVDHQESQTECGLYALYYIRRRLEGTPYSFFFQRRVPDSAMTAFRAHVFRAA